MLVKKNGEVASFKNSAGEVSNAIPNHTDVNKMKILVPNAGTPEGMKLLSSTSPSNAVLTMPPPTIPSPLTQTVQAQSNAAADPSVTVPNLPPNILADRYSPSTVSALNSSLQTTKNTALQASVQGGGGCAGL